MAKHKAAAPERGGDATPEGGRTSSLHSGATMLGEEEVQEVLSVIKSRSLSRDYGPDRRDTVLRFEKGFAEQMGCRYAVAVTSGTAALKTALISAGIGPGDEVIVPCMTFLASPGSVVGVGAVPVFAEIDESLTIDPDDVEAKITPHTAAIMPVHTSGIPCRMDRIMEIAERHDLMVIEDCAQSCGASYKGRHIGTWGHLGAFSLQFGKIITAGEGGAVTSDDARLFERAVRYHDQGIYRENTRFPGIKPEVDEFVGENYRMCELSGAVAVTQLGRLQQIAGLLRARYNRFKQAIADIDGLRLRNENDEAGHLGVSWAFVFDDEETCTRFAKAAREQGLSGGTGGGMVYMQPQILNQETANPRMNPWKWPLYKGSVTYHDGMCPRSENIVRRRCRIASITPRTTEADVDRIIEAVRKAAEAAL